MKLNIKSIIQWSLRWLVPLTAIVGLVLASAQLLKVPMSNPESLCGEWGWLPPTNALVAVHTVWASIIIPLLLTFLFNIPKLRRAKIWKIGFGLAMFVIVCLVGTEVLIYSKYFSTPMVLVRLTLYQLIMMTNIPYIQIAIGCLVNWLICRFWK